MLAWSVHAAEDPSRVRRPAVPPPRAAPRAVAPSGAGGGGKGQGRGQGAGAGAGGLSERAPRGRRS